MTPTPSRWRRHFKLADPLSGLGTLLALSVAAILLFWPQTNSVSQFPISIWHRSMMFLANATLMLQPALLFAMRSPRLLKIPALLLFLGSLYLLYPGLLEIVGLTPTLSNQQAKGFFIPYWAFCGVAFFCNIPVAAANFANSTTRS
jgi:hypothetical protein